MILIIKRKNDVYFLFSFKCGSYHVGISPSRVPSFMVVMTIIIHNDRTQKVVPVLFT